jgi:hypothetical protein
MTLGDDVDWRSVVGQLACMYWYPGDMRSLHAVHTSSRRYLAAENTWCQSMSGQPQCAVWCQLLPTATDFQLSMYCNVSKHHEACPPATSSGLHDAS